MAVRCLSECAEARVAEESGFIANVSVNPMSNPVKIPIKNLPPIEIDLLERSQESKSNNHLMHLMRKPNDSSWSI